VLRQDPGAAQLCGQLLQAGSPVRAQHRLTTLLQTSLPGPPELARFHRRKQGSGLHAIRGGQQGGSLDGGRLGQRSLNLGQGLFRPPASRCASAEAMSASTISCGSRSLLSSVTCSPWSAHLRWPTFCRVSESLLVASQMFDRDTSAEIRRRAFRLP
jgi:hypothetical protein